jgi:hypothetical protein
LYNLVVFCSVQQNLPVFAEALQRERKELEATPTDSEVKERLNRLKGYPGTHEKRFPCLIPYVLYTG